ncbi:MAG: DUF3598 domain-containing protein [Alphaproteobacteria bacterium]|nr:MAG: DUF3598 domain-containing protein [Alphaproteobacteria bacterium]
MSNESVDLRSLMPLLARHEGVWEGVYRYYDALGKMVDEHRSRLICRFPDSGPYPYHQTNHYRWADGRREVRDFPARVKDGRIFWDNDLITGWAADVPLDDFKRTTMLNWVRKGEPETYLYEMIQISDCGKYRHRVWHWYKAGRLLQRTLIDEEKVTTNWAEFEKRNPEF